jgi:hypothetical protein
MRTPRRVHHCTFRSGASNDVGGLSFVRFVKPGENLDSIQAPVDLSGVHLNMKVGVTPDARFELIFDPTVGDIISGAAARGDIAMTVTPSGDFSMKGGRGDRRRATTSSPCATW